MFNIINDYIKIVPVTASDIDCYKYFIAHFTVQDGKQAFQSQRNIIEDKSLDDCVQTLLEGNVIDFSTSQESKSHISNVVPVLKPAGSIRLSKTDLKIKK